MPAPITVYPPDSEDGGRRVRFDGRILGRAYSRRDLLKFLHLVGLEDVDDRWLDETETIEWRGGGSHAWGSAS